MDAPRHRFRRDEPESEGSAEGVTEIDFRLVSIEDELKTVSLSSAMQARDFQALRAKVESLESKSGGDIQDTLTRVFDHVEAQDDRLEQIFERLQVLEGHLQATKVRLDNFGDFGPLESLPGLLEQSLVTSLDDLEARLELKIEALSRSRESGAASQDLEAKLDQLRRETEDSFQELRDSLDKVLEDRQEELLEMVQASSTGPSPEEIKQAVTGDLDKIRHAIVELQEAYESVPTRDELNRVAARGDSALSSSSTDDLTALAGEMTGLKEKFQKLQTQVASLGGDGDLQQKLEALVKFSEQSEQHQEKIDEAMRLVTQLEEKTRNLGAVQGTPSVAAVPDDGLAPPPGESQLKLTLRDLVREMVKNRVSDLHIKTGRAITARIGKDLIQFSTPPLSPADSYHLIASALRTSHRKKLVEERDIEFVYQYESVRLRANVFFDRGNLSATFRMLSNRPPELENLGLPKAFSNLLHRPAGLVVVCGLPGSGRSTTLTASLDFLNRTKQLHLMSLEDRLEFTHEDRRSLVTQRELNSDISSFAQGTRRALGQDSDVIFISDLGDRATMEAVFSAVDSGLLVIGAITAQSIEDAIPRLINLFPETERKMRARLFSRCLLGMLALRLFERADGEGQIPASELLLANSTVKRLIEDANLSALHRQIASGVAEGMQTFSDSIERLVETGLILAESAKVELDRLAAAGKGPVGGGAQLPTPSLAKTTPPTRVLEPPTAQPAAFTSGESSSPVVPDSPGNEAFGEEDTLMNWL